MADFIVFEADASDLSDDENFEMEVDNPTLVDDADEQQNNNPSLPRLLEKRPRLRSIWKQATTMSMSMKRLKSINLV